MFQTIARKFGLVYVAKGKKPEKFIPLPIIPITKENLSEAISWEISDENYERAVEYIGGIDDWEALGFSEKRLPSREAFFHFGTLKSISLKE